MCFQVDEKDDGNILLRSARGRRPSRTQQRNKGRLMLSDPTGFEDKIYTQYLFLIDISIWFDYEQYFLSTVKQHHSVHFLSTSKSWVALGLLVDWKMLSATRGLGFITSSLDDDDDDDADMTMIIIIIK